MFKYIHVFGPIFILWVVGFLIEITCYKFLTAGKDVNLKENEEEQTDPVLKDAISVFKHFKISFIVYAVSIIASMIIPVTELRWLFFFACAMVMCPVVYDVLYSTLKNAFKSKERFLIALPSLYNILIIAVTLFFHYFAYMHKEF